MKNRIIQGVVAAAVLSVGAFSYGQTSNAIPSQQTFEEIAVGNSITNFNGWSGSPDVVSSVTNVNNSNWSGGAVLFPVPSATHSNVLQFSEGSLSNRFETYAGTTNMTVDFMVQPVRSEDRPNADIVAGSQTALYLDSNGFLNVWYGIDAANTNNNTWMAFTNTPPLGTSDWARVTVVFDYTSDVGNLYQYFTVKVNGFSMIPTNNIGYTAPDGNLTTGGPWLFTANQTPKQVQSFAMSGSGMMDDFVITTNAVTNFAPIGGGYTISGVVVGVHGTISPATTNVAPGASPEFVVTAGIYYRIASLMTNGSPVGMTFGNSSTVTNFIWSNVLANGILSASFTEQLANNAAQTPYWWLAKYGLTNYNTDAVADQDKDGMLTWQEYIVGTDPTNAASLLKVLSVTSDGVTNTVKWLSSTSAPNYNLLYSTNLLGVANGWTMASNNIVIDAPTNTVSFTPPVAQAVFYKITVTN